MTRLRSEAALTPLGLRPLHLVALTLLRDHGGTTQQALAGALEIDRPNLVGLLNELELDNLVARRRSADDRRRHIVELTDAGLRRLAQADEREQLSGLLQRATAGHILDCVAAATRCEARPSTSPGPPAA